jgi:23S rRNA (adenine2503-C2)-methyltransferase
VNSRDNAPEPGPPEAGAIADIRSQTQEDLQARFAGWKEPAYRAAQLLQWLYTRRVTRWDAMTNLPAALRRRLSPAFSFYSFEMARRQGADDSTQKFLWRLSDGAFIETVLIQASPGLYGEASDRHTLCVSSQVGCAYGCRFCASGLDGWKRNLRAEEIVEQVLAVERWHAARPPSPSGPAPAAPGARIVNNLVVMGMGEPLANYDNLLRALRILNAPWGGGIGARRITISTSGLVPQIRRLAEEPAQFRLAISLHGATDEVRARLMPVNTKYPLAQLAAAARYYQEKKGGMMTLEYILIAGVNDGPDQIKPLAALARGLAAKVNLIPYNPVPGLPWAPPEEAAQDRFLAALEREKAAATLRREKGRDIDAACGQLRLKTEQELRMTGEPNNTALC